MFGDNPKNYSGLCGQIEQAVANKLPIDGRFVKINKRRRCNEVSERISVKDAAEILGCRPQGVREKMKRGIWDLGEAISPKQSGKQHWEYHIYRAKIEHQIGRALEGRLEVQ